MVLNIILRTPTKEDLEKIKINKIIEVNDDKEKTNDEKISKYLSEEKIKTYIKKYDMYETPKKKDDDYKIKDTLPPKIGENDKIERLPEIIIKNEEEIKNKQLLELEKENKNNKYLEILRYSYNYKNIKIEFSEPLLYNKSEEIKKYIKIIPEIEGEFSLLDFTILKFETKENFKNSHKYTFFIDKNIQSQEKKILEKDFSFFFYTNTIDYVEHHPRKDFKDIITISFNQKIDASDIFKNHLDFLGLQKDQFKLEEGNNIDPKSLCMKYIGKDLKQSENSDNIDYVIILKKSIYSIESNVKDDVKVSLGRDIRIRIIPIKKLYIKHYRSYTKEEKIILEFEFNNKIKTETKKLYDCIKIVGIEEKKHKKNFFFLV